MNKEAKELFFKNADPTRNCKDFWNACKPFLSDKDTTNGRRILLVENENIISDDRDIATVFNEYFCNITKFLLVPKWSGISSSIEDPVSD